jgi:multidrug resistance efflux pump
VVAIAATTVWLLYRKYVTDPWTRDSQIRANIVGIAPRVAGPIVNIPVHDNQEVKAGDLLFEIDPSDYKTALASAKASVANLEANLLQKQQDLDRKPICSNEMSIPDSCFRTRRTLMLRPKHNSTPPGQICSKPSLT